jgi:nucleotide-binding universal stress UspA family protein
MYRHILIATDGSELARRAVRHGLSLAKAVGAKVTALTVEGSFDVYTVPASKVYEMSEAFAEHAERAKAHAEKILNGVAEEARLAGVICETVHIEEDHPYEAIIATAEQRGCDRHGLARKERDCGNRAWECDDQGAYAHENSGSCLPLTRSVTAPNRAPGLRRRYTASS